MCEVKTRVFMSILAWKSFKLRGEIELWQEQKQVAKKQPLKTY
jgi:hypothetical protein